MLNVFVNFLGLGVTIGLTTGLIPGPFQAVVISQTIKHNFIEGVKVALSVLITDIIFIIFALLLLYRIAISDTYMGIISLFGSLYLTKLAYENFTVKTVSVKLLENVKPKSIEKGIVTLFLSPGSYIFWFTVGGPTIIRSYNISILAFLAFIGGLYISFVGSNIGVAALVSKSRGFLKSKLYVYTIRALGGLLLIFAALFLRNGLRMLNLL